MRVEINLELLREGIRDLQHNKELYKTLQEELLKADHWKAKKRGNPKEAGKASFKKRRDGGLIPYMGWDKEKQLKSLEKCPFILQKKVRVKKTGDVGRVVYIYYNGYCMVDTGKEMLGCATNNNCAYKWEDLEKVE